MKNTLVQDLLRDWGAYRPELTRAPDFPVFWKRVLAESATVPLRVTLEPHTYPIPGMAVFDLTFDACDGTRIHGWYVVPTGTAPTSGWPCLIHYHGLGGNRGYPTEYAPWIMLGMAVVAIDCRDQSGETGTVGHWSNGQMGHLYLRGILDPNEFYVTRLYSDAVRAVHVACAQAAVDPQRIVIEGGSQGGALVMAVAALDPRPALALADVPSNSDLRQRVLGGHGGYSCVPDYLKAHPERLDQCLATLSYVDTMNLADRIRCPVYASVGGRDPICPPKLFFATYNRLTAPKAVEVYPFNGHEGGGMPHFERKLQVTAQFLATRKGPWRRTRDANVQH